MSHSPQDLHKKLLGRRGEKLVAAYIKKRKMKLLKANYRTPFGEADLVALDGDEVVFIEVKTRAGESFGAPKDAVGASKQARYERIARYYWAQTGEEPNARFDVAEVYEDGRINYIKNAF